MRLITALIFLVACGTTALAADVQRTLALSGLTCVACAPAVTKALKQITGVRAVSINDDRTRATVVADENVPPAALIEAVEKAGYHATVAGTKERGA